MKTPVPAMDRYRGVFREYDLRGHAERDLTSELATAVGRAFAEMLLERRAGRPASPPSKRKPASKRATSAKAPAGSGPGAGAASSALRIAVGRDCRLSSPRLHEALVAGLRNAGAQVLDIGVGPTPLLYFAVHTLSADGGVMITGSHNPGDENGFKLMEGKRPFHGEDLLALLTRAAAVGDESRPAGAARETGSYQEVDLQPAYVDSMREAFGDLPALAGISLVLDAGNGSGGPLALRTLRALGLEPEALYCDMDGRFPHHHPDPTVPANVAALVQRVLATRARLGVAFDGDGDRLGVVTDTGEILWGDKLLTLFARHVLARNPGATVVGEVKCSQALYDDVAKHGGTPLMWKTGHSLIKAKMQETCALLAGEMSGHFFFADRSYGYDDALYATLRLLEILSKDPRSLGEMLADLPPTFATLELREPCPDEIKREVVRRVAERYRQKGRPVNDLDGARISFDDGAWGLVRASNTGPLLVMRFEAKSAAERDRLQGEVSSAVAEERAALAPGA